MKSQAASIWQASCLWLARRPQSWRVLGTVIWLWGMTALLASCEIPAQVERQTPTAATAAAVSAQELNIPLSGISAFDAEDSSLIMRGEMEIWHSLSGADLDFLEEAIRQVERSYPELILTHTHVSPHKVTSELLKAILSGRGPELLLAPASRLPEFSAEGLVEPLNSPLWEEQREDLVAPAIFGLIHDQGLMGLPLWAETVVLYVNTDLIGQAEVPGNTEELLAMAQETTEPLMGIYLSLFHLSWGFQAFGGVLFDAAHKVVLDQSDGGSDFLKWLQLAHDSTGITVSTDYNSLLDSFLAGELPLFLDGPWSLAEAEEALGNSLLIREIPAGPFGPARPWLTTEAIILVPGQSQTQRLVSAEVASTLLSLEDEMIEIAYRLPASQRRMQAGSRAINSFRKLLENTQHMPHEPEMASVWRLGNELLIGILENDEAATDFSASVARFTLLANEENGK